MNPSVDQYEVLREAEPLMDQYSEQIDAVSKVQTDLQDHEAMTMAILLDNTEKQIKHYARRKQLSDSTYSEVVGPFIKHAMNIISALYATFDLKEIISIQPLKQKIGALYFLNYLYGSDKGDITTGDVAFSPKEAPVRKGHFSSQKVENEPLELANSGGDAVATLAYYPIQFPENISIVLVGGALAGTYTYLSVTGTTISLQKDAGAAEAATLDSATGLFTIASGGASVASLTGQVATYWWNSEKYATKGMIPRITVRVDETEVRATRRQLLFDIMLDASYDYESQFGRNMNAEVEAGIIQEMQNELSYEILDRMYAEATGNQGNTFTFDLTPNTALTLSDHAQFFAKHLSEQSTQLFNNLGRGRANYIVTGSDLFNFFESLPNTIWAPSGQNDGSARGPFLAGTFMSKYKVYYNPAYPAAEYITGFKGKDWWEAPYYVGTYLPLMATKFMLFPDLHGEQGYISMDAHEYLFPKHVIKASVTESA